MIFPKVTIGGLPVNYYSNNKTQKQVVKNELIFSHVDDLPVRRSPNKDIRQDPQRPLMSQIWIHLENHSIIVSL